MSVTGYLALYTTLLGWQQYESLWGIAVGTGLIYLPFVGIVLKSAFVPFTSMGAKDAAQIAVRRLSLNVLMALLVIAFAAAPAVRLDPKVLHYEPFCTQSAKQATPGNTGTTYDSMPIPTGVRVPIFWYLVMAVSNGVTHAAEVGLGCSPIDYRLLHTQLNTSKINDTQLEKEVVDFYQYCYEPALSDYNRHKMTDGQEAQAKQSIQKNGQDDIKWLGSETFMTVGGFYDTHRSSESIKGFPYVPSRDFEDGQVGTPKYGKPDCKSWWADPTSGLHKRLTEKLPPSLLQTLRNFGDHQKAEEAAIKTLVGNSIVYKQPHFSDTMRGYESLDDNSGGAISRFATKLGVEYEGLSFFPKLHLLQNALPIIQGALLFALYAFLGIAMPFSSYRISFCVTAAIIIFSIIFCSYIWHLTQWFDNYLLEALYRDKDLLSSKSLMDILSLPDANKLFTEMIIGTMYVVLPFLWLMVMGWIGVQAGGLISGAMAPATGPANDAGQSTRGITTSAAKSAGRAVL